MAVCATGIIHILATVPLLQERGYKIDNHISATLKQTKAENQEEAILLTQDHYMSSPLPAPPCEIHSFCTCFRGATSLPGLLFPAKGTFSDVFICFDSLIFETSK